jgi:hypothetical protein
MGFLFIMSYTDDWAAGDTANVKDRVAFDFSAQIAVQIVRQFAVQMEFVFTSDNMDIDYEYYKETVTSLY